MDRYAQSLDHLERAEAVIPLASQTFSKSRANLPTPVFLERGLGSRVWDLDGNEYTDYVNGLASISLGYRDLDVDAAVQKQMGSGVSFSLPHPLEAEVAEMVIDAVPCAEMVRFGKNGSDATSAAVRLARAYTGRENVAVCGYHGWQDWYIGSTDRGLGVPTSTKALTHTFDYNDPDSLRYLLRLAPFAAVIMEPMRSTWPEGFLEEVRAITKDHGALLIFDEMITGFRFAYGGAQEFFGVTPDLATFGKGIANGYPLSVLAGKREYMTLMEKVFYSSTFGGETLSLAAAKAVLHKMKCEPVLEHLEDLGRRLQRGFESLSKPFCGLSGHPAWTFFDLPDPRLKQRYIQEMLDRRILTLGTHNLSYSHTEADIDRLLEVYAEVIPALEETCVS